MQVTAVPVTLLLWRYVWLTILSRSPLCSWNHQLVFAVYHCCLLHFNTNKYPV